MDSIKWKCFYRSYINLDIYKNHYMVEWESSRYTDWEWQTKNLKQMGIHLDTLYILLKEKPNDVII